MTLQLPHHIIVGERPILATATQEGGLDVLGYDWVGGGFLRDMHAWESLFDGGIDARCVNEGAFCKHVQTLRQRSETSQAQRSHPLDRLVNNINNRDEKGLLDRSAALEKAYVEYNGEVSRITNIVCNSIVFDSIEKLRAATRSLSEQGEVVRLMDRFAEPLIDGWRDVLLNIRASNGHIGQIEMTLQAFVEMRKAQLDLYQEQWAINKRRLVEDRPFSALEARRIVELLKEQNQTYERALAQ